MKLLATLCAFLFSGIIGATSLHNVVIFGDSLSDNGNLYEIMKHQLPQSPPYFEGRFSNGPVWIERLMASYFPNDSSSHLQNFAIGGAGVFEDENEEDDVLFTLRREIKNYLAVNNDKAEEDSLYILWIGANNYLGMPSEIEQTLIDVNTGITHGLQTLIDKGAKHIFVLNLPDLGKTPAATEFGSIDTFSYFSNQHNEALNKTLVDLRQTHPDVNLLFFDMNNAYNEVWEHASEYGFTNVTDTCISLIADDLSKPSFLKMIARAKQKRTNDICEGYLFFDLVHPTAQAHQILAGKARTVLDAAGIELVDK